MAGSGEPAIRLLPEADAALLEASLRCPSPAAALHTLQIWARDVALAATAYLRDAFNESTTSRHHLDLGGFASSEELHLSSLSFAVGATIPFHLYPSTGETSTSSTLRRSFPFLSSALDWLDHLLHQLTNMVLLSSGVELQIQLLSQQPSGAAAAGPSAAVYETHCSSSALLLQAHYYPTRSSSSDSSPGEPAVSHYGATAIEADLLQLRRHATEFVEGVSYHATQCGVGRPPYPSSVLLASGALCLQLEVRCVVRDLFLPLPVRRLPFVIPRVPAAGSAEEPKAPNSTAGDTPSFRRHRGRTQGLVLRVVYQHAMEVVAAAMCVQWRGDQQRLRWDGGSLLHPRCSSTFSLSCNPDHPLPPLFPLSQTPTPVSRSLCGPGRHLPEGLQRIFCHFHPTPLTAVPLPAIQHRKAVQVPRSPPVTQWAQRALPATPVFPSLTDRVQKERSPAESPGSEREKEDRGRQVAERVGEVVFTLFPSLLPQHLLLASDLHKNTSSTSPSGERSTMMQEGGAAGARSPVTALLHASSAAASSRSIFTAFFIQEKAGAVSLGNVAHEISNPGHAESLSCVSRVASGSEYMMVVFWSIPFLRHRVGTHAGAASKYLKLRGRMEATPLQNAPSSTSSYVERFLAQMGQGSQPCGQKTRSVAVQEEGQAKASQEGPTTERQAARSRKRRREGPRSAADGGQVPFFPFYPPPLPPVLLSLQGPACSSEPGNPSVPDSLPDAHSYREAVMAYARATGAVPLLLVLSPGLLPPTVQEGEDGAESDHDVSSIPLGGRRAERILRFTRSAIPSAAFLPKKGGRSLQESPEHRFHGLYQTALQRFLRTASPVGRQWSTIPTGSTEESTPGAGQATEKKEGGGGPFSNASSALAFQHAQYHLRRGMAPVTPPVSSGADPVRQKSFDPHAAWRMTLSRRLCPGRSEGRRQVLRHLLDTPNSNPLLYIPPAFHRAVPWYPSQETPRYRGRRGVLSTTAARITPQSTIKMKRGGRNSTAGWKSDDFPWPKVEHEQDDERHMAQRSGSQETMEEEEAEQQYVRSRSFLSVLDPCCRSDGTTPKKKAPVVLQWNRKFFVMIQEQEITLEGQSPVPVVSWAHWFSPSGPENTDQQHTHSPITASTLPEPGLGLVRRLLIDPSASWWLLDPHAMHERLRLELFLVFAEAYVIHPEITASVVGNPGVSASHDVPDLIRQLQQVGCLLRSLQAKQRPSSLQDGDGFATSGPYGFPVPVPQDLIPAVIALQPQLWRWGWRFTVHHAISGEDAWYVIHWPILRVEGFSFHLNAMNDLRIMIEDLQWCSSLQPHADDETRSVSRALPASTVLPSAVLSFLISRSCRGAVMLGDLVTPAAMWEWLQCLQRVSHSFIRLFGFVYYYYYFISLFSHFATVVPSILQRRFVDSIIMTKYFSLNYLLHKLFLFLFLFEITSALSRSCSGVLCMSVDRGDATTGVEPIPSDAILVKKEESEKDHRPISVSSSSLQIDSFYFPSNRSVDAQVRWEALKRHPHGLGVGCLVFAPRRKKNKPSSSLPRTLPDFPFASKVRYGLAEITGVQSSAGTITVAFLFSHPGVDDESFCIFDVIPCAVEWLWEHAPVQVARTTWEPPSPPPCSLLEHILAIPLTAGSVPEEELFSEVERTPSGPEKAGDPVIQWLRRLYQGSDQREGSPSSGPKLLPYYHFHSSVGKTCTVSPLFRPVATQDTPGETCFVVDYLSVPSLHQGYAVGFRGIDYLVSSNASHPSTATDSPSADMSFPVTLCLFDSFALLNRFQHFMSVRGHTVHFLNGQEIYNDSSEVRGEGRKRQRSLSPLSASDCQFMLGDTASSASKMWICLLREDAAHLEITTKLLAEVPSVHFFIHCVEDEPDGLVTSMAKGIVQMLSTPIHQRWTLVFKNFPSQGRPALFKGASVDTRTKGMKVSGEIFKGHKLLVPPSPEQLLLLATVAAPSTDETDQENPLASPALLERIALGNLTDLSAANLFGGYANVKAFIPCDKKHGAPTFLSSIKRLHHNFVLNPLKFGESFPVFAAALEIIHDTQCRFEKLSKEPNNSRCYAPRVVLIFPKCNPSGSTQLASEQFLMALKLYLAPQQVYQLIALEVSTWSARGGILILHCDDTITQLSCLHFDADLVIACGKRAAAWVAASEGTGMVDGLSGQDFFAVISEIEISPVGQSRTWVPYRIEARDYSFPSEDSLEAVNLWNRLEGYYSSGGFLSEAPKPLQQAMTLFQQEKNSDWKNVLRLCRSVVVACATASPIRRVAQMVERSLSMR
eukprot:gene6827-4906_t